MDQLDLFEEARPEKNKKRKPKSAQLRQAEKRKRNARKGYVEISLKVKINTKKRLAQIAKNYAKNRGEIIDQLIELQNLDSK